MENWVHINAELNGQGWFIITIDTHLSEIMILARAYREEYAGKTSGKPEYEPIEGQRPGDHSC